MNYKNKLMGLSLIIVAMFSACSDEVENGGRDSSTGDHRITFAVSTVSDAQTRSESTPELHESDPVEMQGKLGGKSVYLTAEVSDGFPGDDQPLTRGTQVTSATQIDAFGVSAFTSGSDADPWKTPDVMYNVKVKKNNASSAWMPDETYYWPTGKNLNFFAWYPYESEYLNISGKSDDMPFINYEVPELVTNQLDVMGAIAAIQSETNSVSLRFQHLLTAVKFKTSTDMPACTIKSITLKDVKYKGRCSVSMAGAFKPLPFRTENDTKDFTLFVNKKNTEIELSGEGETFFMMPQLFGDDSNAQLEVKLEIDGAEQTLYANLKDISTSWREGTTITYTLSYNYVTIVVSNGEFIAYVDDDAKLKDQICFEVWASTSKSTTETGTISVTSGSGITISPTSFSAEGYTNNVPVYVTWEPGVSDGVITVSVGSKSKQVLLHREPPEKDGAFYLYSVPETTSKPFGKDFFVVYNKSEAQWLTMTKSSSYDKNARYQSSFDNHQSMEDIIYLQTLSIPTEDRFASLWATTTFATGKENVMYCVQQKAGFTADFGFKDCERNISREAEQWNIVVDATGTRLKDDATKLQARVVISSSVDDTQISDLGRNLTYNAESVDISIDKTMATGIASYVKKCWDNQTENTANNGTRAVNVQLYDDNSETWYDIAGTGTMADWMPWGGVANVYQGPFVISNRSSAVNTNIYWGLVYPTYTATYMVHENHPFFGKTKWQVPVNADMNNLKAAYDDKNTATGYIWANRKALHGFGTGGVASDITGISYIILLNTSTVQTYANYQANQIEPMSKCRVFGIGAQSTNPNTKTVDWNQPQTPKLLIANIPVIYTVRPTNDAPITGTSVNE
ncbi:fimbrillin family protein [uncultured Parabacteroides sp.]|uniref:fimbrillin family protein n=1 Tax=uncultured Parabacteroides sp. TaxID=512312 RepID=UPI002805CDF4|nr:fimbrillin family protein [uncultured Parabacteroides sp.]